MKIFTFLIFFGLGITQAVAQENHFIYIQTENKQPFYVRFGDRLLSSSIVGYLVIPKLQDGIYELGIGFPKNEWPLQKITVTVKNNVGYLLKNFDPKGWGLFNIQTMDIVMASGTAAPKETAAAQQADGFADALADVVNTPSIKQKPVAKEDKEAKPAEPAKQEKTAEIQTHPVIQAVAENIKQEKSVAAIKPAVKLFSTIDDSGRSAVYADNFEDRTDTIRIFIPYQSTPAAKEIQEKPADITKPVINKDSAAPAPGIKNSGDQPAAGQAGKSIDIEVQSPGTKKDSLPVLPDKKTAEANPSAIIITDKTAIAKADNQGLMVNSDCKSYASDNDFMKLRKKMASGTTDEEMIAAAKKAFRSKCYSTEQINNLSVLFLKDAGRYDFFDTAYPHVIDTRNYGILVSRLTDEYYINRFNAMIRH